MRPNTTLRRLRDRLNLSQEELAERLRETGRELGLNLAADAKRVGRWERGEVAWPSPAYRRVLRAFFGVASVAELGFRSPFQLVPAVPAETVVDLDALARAAAVLGTDPGVATVNQALRLTAASGSRTP